MLRAGIMNAKCFSYHRGERKQNSRAGSFANERLNVNRRSNYPQAFAAVRNGFILIDSVLFPFDLCRKHNHLARLMAQGQDRSQ